MLVDITTRTSPEGQNIQVKKHNALSAKSQTVQEHCTLHALSTKKEKHLAEFSYHA